MNVAETGDRLVLSNGRESKSMDTALSCGVLWGSHFYCIGASRTVDAFSLDFKLKFSFRGDPYCIITSNTILAFQNGISNSVSVVDRSFEGQNLEQSFDLESDDPKRFVDCSREVKTEVPLNWTNGNAFQVPVIGKIHILCAEICPFTSLIVLLNRTKDFDFIQRGNDAVSLHSGLDSRLVFHPIRSSYSAKWYVVGYPDAEPEDCYLFLVDQKTLALRAEHRFDRYSGYSVTPHFLKPHKDIFPFLINPGKDFWFCCEFRDHIYQLSSLNATTAYALPESFFLMHLSGRVWLCLETFSKAHLLIVDTDRFYKLLQLN